MRRERAADCGDAYRAHRQALCSLLASCSADELELRVPASPEWRVRDVLGHVAGLCADLNAGRFPSGDAAAWTAEQVADRAGRSLDEVISEWSSEGPAFEDGLRMLGYEVGAHFFADLLAHEVDVRGALGLPGLVTVEGWPVGSSLAIGVDWYLDVAHRAISDAGAPALEVVVEGEATNVGDGTPAASVELDAFEAFRALGGRRTLGQLRALPWQGDPAGSLELLCPYGFPAADLIDRPAER